MSNDVFISYRRDSGATVARLIYHALKPVGITCFFDSESIGSGDFSEHIKSNLESCNNFIFIVSSRVFERCNNPDDWVRKEIEIALRLKKKIIPIFVNGINSFPPGLPESIAEIQHANAIELNHKDFDGNLKKLISWIDIEKKDRVVNYFFDMHDPKDPEELTWMLETLGKLVPSNEFMLLARQHIKKYWSGELAVLLEGYNDPFMKELCRNLELDQSGGAEMLIERIEAWVNGRESSDTIEERLASSIQDWLVGNLSKEDLAKCCTVEGLDVDKRSADKMRNELCTFYMSDELIAELINNLSSVKLKEMTRSVLGELEADKKKAELAQLLCEKYRKGSESKPTSQVIPLEQ
jgi:hypothetical protein